MQVLFGRVATGNAIFVKSRYVSITPSNRPASMMHLGILGRNLPLLPLSVAFSLTKFSVAGKLQVAIDANCGPRLCQRRLILLLWSSPRPRPLSHSHSNDSTAPLARTARKRKSSQQPNPGTTNPWLSMSHDLETYPRPACRVASGTRTVHADAYLQALLPEHGSPIRTAGEQLRLRGDGL
jgi:hypothetical protein